MTTTARVCTACHNHPTPQSSYLCQPCADQLHGDLHAAPELARELRLEAAGLARHTQQAPMITSSPEPRLPINFAASNALRELRKALTAAATSAIRGRPRALGMPTGSIPRIVDALTANEHHITGHPTAGDIANRIARAITRARRIIDNPPELIYIGKCLACLEGDGTGPEKLCRDCGRHHGGTHPRLYARAGQPTHTCRSCGYTHDAIQMWEDLQDEIADYGLTRDEIGTLMSSIKRQTIDSWIARGNLPQLGTTATGEPIYRYGDVLALDARRRTRKRAS